MGPVADPVELGVPSWLEQGEEPVTAASNLFYPPRREQVLEVRHFLCYFI